MPDAAPLTVAVGDQWSEDGRRVGLIVILYDCDGDRHDELRTEDVCSLVVKRDDDGKFEVHEIKAGDLEWAPARGDA